MSCRLVEVCSAEGVPQAQIARALGVDEKTLRRHYRRELDVGATRFESMLALRLLDIAGGRDATALKAAIFLLRAKFGWSEFLPPPRQ